MRRFRRRRRRLAVAALLPIAAIYMTATSFGASARPARIDASDGTVPVGERVTLRGAFPGAHKAAFEVRYRAKGVQAWKTVGHGRTGAGGAYRAAVRPRRSGYWRAELAAAPKAQAAAADGTAAEPATVDGSTGNERISVRSDTTAKVSGRNAGVGDTVKVRGTVTPEGRRRVVVRIGDDKEVTRTRKNGRFAVRWDAPSTGTYPVHVKARTNRFATGSGDSAGRVTVYRPAAASWYGPGLYGNNLACGGTLTPSTMGVAHKTLPCGTKLRLRYHGRTVNVRVIDRGPFSGSREFDLTEATKNALHFPDVGTVLSSR
jgi:rare lipoprotein A